MVAIPPVCTAPDRRPLVSAAPVQRSGSGLLPLFAWALVAGAALIGCLGEPMRSAVTSADGASPHGRCVSWVFVAPAALYHLLTR